MTDDLEPVEIVEATIEERYPKEYYPQDSDVDDGTMPENVNTLAEAVVGHRILSVERTSWSMTTRGGSTYTEEGHILTLDNNKRVKLQNSSDCCAYTELESFLKNVEMVNHVITGVGTTDGFTKWHIYADMGDLLELTVGWSPGNPFYYGYGFNITVEDVPVYEAIRIEPKEIEVGR